jgi:hypothetical protein
MCPVSITVREPASAAAGLRTGIGMAVGISPASAMCDAGKPAALGKPPPS